MAFITVNQGGPEIPDGVYTVTLVEISDPKTVTAQRGPKAGSDIDLLDWTFAVDDGGPYDGQTIREATSTASGPKSKMYSWLTALFGGQPPQVGASFEKTDLCGRRALATIRRDEAGWPRLVNLGAMPAAMLQQGFAQRTGAPVKPPAVASGRPLRQQVAAAAEGDMPF